MVDLIFRIFRSGRRRGFGQAEISLNHGAFGKWRTAHINELELAGFLNGSNNVIRIGQTGELAHDTAGAGGLKKILADAISKLSDRERMVITLYYYEELTSKEIGKILGVSDSRVSQLHTKAILRLRGRLSRIKEALMQT